MISFESRKRVVRASLFDTLFSGLGGSIHEFVAGTVKKAVDDVLGWLLGLVVNSLIAAALLIASAVFLLTAVVQGLIALGLPVWSAHLILAVVAGGAGILLLKRGSPRKPDGDEDREIGGGGLTIRLVRDGHASRSAARKRPRPTARHRVLDVHGTREGTWEVKTRRARKPGETFDTKEKAVEAAKKEAVKDPSAQIVIRKTDGTFQKDA